MSAKTLQILEDFISKSRGGIVNFRKVVYNVNDDDDDDDVIYDDEFHLITSLKRIRIDGDSDETLPNSKLTTSMVLDSTARKIHLALKYIEDVILPGENAPESKFPIVSMVLDDVVSIAIDDEMTRRNGNSNIFQPEFGLPGFNLYKADFYDQVHINDVLVTYHDINTNIIIRATVSQITSDSSKKIKSIKMKNFELYTLDSTSIVIPPEGIVFSKIEFGLNGLPKYDRDSIYSKHLKTFFLKLSNEFTHVIVNDEPILANVFFWFAPVSPSEEWDGVWSKIFVSPIRWKNSPVSYVEGSKYYFDLKWIASIVRVAPNPERIPIPNTLYYALNVLNGDTKPEVVPWKELNSLSGSSLNVTNPAVNANTKIVQIVRKYSNGIGIAVLHNPSGAIQRKTPSRLERPLVQPIKHIPTIELGSDYRSMIYPRKARSTSNYIYRKMLDVDDTEEDLDYIDPSIEDDLDEDDDDGWESDQLDEDTDTTDEKSTGHQKSVEASKFNTLTNIDPSELVGFDWPITIAQFEFIHLGGDESEVSKYVGSQSVNGDAFGFLQSLSQQFQSRLRYSNGLSVYQFLTFDPKLIVNAPDVNILASDSYSKPTIKRPAWLFWYIVCVVDLCTPTKKSIAIFQDALNTHWNNKGWREDGKKK